MAKNFKIHDFFQKSLMTPWKKFQNSRFFPKITDDPMAKNSKIGDFFEVTSWEKFHGVDTGRIKSRKVDFPISSRSGLE